MSDTQYEIVKKHFKTALSTLGKPYQITRDEKFLLSITGIPNETNGEPIVGFEPDLDVRKGDTLTTVEDKRYIVKNTTIEYVKSKPIQLIVFLSEN